jgi:hypothetical protein
MHPCPDDAMGRGPHRALTIRLVTGLAISGTTTASLAQNASVTPRTTVPIRAIVVSGLQHIRESIVLDQEPAAGLPRFWPGAARAKNGQPHGDPRPH